MKNILTSTPQQNNRFTSSGARQLMLLMAASALSSCGLLKNNEVEKATPRIVYSAPSDTTNDTQPTEEVVFLSEVTPSLDELLAALKSDLYNLELHERINEIVNQEQTQPLFGVGELVDSRANEIITSIINQLPDDIYHGKYASLGDVEKYIQIVLSIFGHDRCDVHTNLDSENLFICVSEGGEKHYFTITIADKQEEVQATIKQLPRSEKVSESPEEGKMRMQRFLRELSLETQKVFKEGIGNSEKTLGKILEEILVPVCGIHGLSYRGFLQSEDQPESVIIFLEDSNGNRIEIDIPLEQEQKERKRNYEDDSGEALIA